jgi:hypothetical protein
MGGKATKRRRGVGQAGVHSAPREAGRATRSAAS